MTAGRERSAGQASLSVADDWDEMVREAHEAERYSRKLAERVSDGYSAKFHRFSDPGGNAPLGFHRSPEPPHLLEPDPSEIDRAVGLFRRYASGATSIRRLAAEADVPVHVVAETLRNPVYNGWVSRRGSERMPARWRPSPPVDDTLWEQVATIREREASFSGRLPKSPDLLRHLLRCVCGQRVTSNGRSHGYRQRMHPATGCVASHPATTDEDRAAIAAAIYAEVTVTRAGIQRVRLTPDAYSHGLALAMSERVRVAMVSPGGFGPTVATVPIEGRAAWVAAAKRTA